MSPEHSPDRLVAILRQPSEASQGWVAAEDSEKALSTILKSTPRCDSKQHPTELFTSAKQSEMGILSTQTRPRSVRSTMLGANAFPKAREAAKKKDWNESQELLARLGRLERNLGFDKTQFRNETRAEVFATLDVEFDGEPGAAEKKRLLRDGWEKIYDRIVGQVREKHDQLIAEHIKQGTLGTSQSNCSRYPKTARR